MPWRKSPVIFSECVQIWSFWTDFCQSTYWKFVQANRFGQFGRTADRGDAATNCCSLVNRNCTTLCCVRTWFVAVARRTDGRTLALPRHAVACCAYRCSWCTDVQINAFCKLIFNRDSFDKGWGHLNALGLMQILFPFSPICTFDYNFVCLKYAQVLCLVLAIWTVHDYGSVNKSCLWVCRPCSNCMSRRFGGSNAPSSEWLSGAYWCLSKLICRLCTLCYVEGHSAVSIAHKSLYPC